MSYLGAADETDPVITALYAADESRMGYVANYTRVFALRPQVYAAWQGLAGAVRSTMSLRRYELATLGAARMLESSYCSLAHGSILAGELGADPVRAIAGGDLTGLSEEDAAVVRLAETVASGGRHVRPDQLDDLRRLGFSDPEILDVILTASIRCFFSTVLDATGAEPDRAYRGLEAALRDALTVGRAIQSEVPE